MQFSVLLLILAGSSCGLTMSQVVAPNRQSCLEDPFCTEFSTFLQDLDAESSISSIYFYPGVYTLQTKGEFFIVFENLINVTIASINIGSPARIQCSERFKLVWIFESCINVLIQGIDMVDCSSSVKSLSRFDSPILANLTVLIVNCANISFNNTYVSDRHGNILLYAYKNKEYFIISNCTFSGTVQLLYPNHFQSMKSVHFVVFGSNFQTLENDLTVSSGLTFDSLESTGNISILIMETRFYSIQKGLYRFLLSIYFDECNSLDVQVINVTVNQSGASIRSSRDVCSPDLHQRVSISIQYSFFIGMLERSGLEIAGSWESSSYDYPIVSFIYSKVVSSSSGMRLSFVTAFIENAIFERNTAALHVDHSNVYFTGKSVFSRNTEKKSSFSAILLRNKAELYVNDYLKVVSNYGRKYSAVVVRSSNLFVQGTAHFLDNQGFYGGALSFYYQSFLTLGTFGSIEFTGNHALKNGGAIYVDNERDCADNEGFLTNCFYRFTWDNTAGIRFCNNTSIQGGDAIFGGSIDDCSKNPIEKTQFTFCDEDNSTSLISSNPRRLCFCSKGLVIQDQFEKNVSVVPGRIFKLSVAAVGQRYGTTIATVRATFLGDYGQVFVDHLQKRQLIDRSCSVVSYTVYGIPQKKTLYLTLTELSDADIEDNTENAISFRQIPIGEFSPEIPLSLNIELQECPIGYVFRHDTLSCACIQSLVAANVQCNIDNGTVRKTKSQWINVTTETVVIHDFCPFTYCQSEHKDFQLSEPSLQCAFNRSGLLCGRCKGNLSHVLGSYNCKDCSNTWLLLIVPLSAVSGILLVIFIASLNLTVAAGTLNGLILFANIVRANDMIFFSKKTYIITDICQVFVAWLNLDLGIEACFYNGLDAYAKTMFQLTFPTYICTLVVMIMVSSHYSTRAARLSGTNAVQVLATLFFLSYAKLVRLVITTFTMQQISI